MDITQQIQNTNIIYGASDYTAAHTLGASKSLNYANGPSIQRPDVQSCTSTPHTFEFKSSAGLFGAENYFTLLKCDLNKDSAVSCYEELNWECAKFGTEELEEPYWTGAVVKLEEPCATVNTYECATITGNTLPTLRGDTYVSVDLVNNGTGNIYNDDWLDVRLYTSQREEHPFSRMWIKKRDSFYVGIHVRNTKRVTFDVSCILGKEITNYEGIANKEEIMRVIH